jgi:hypothetical protein
MICVQRLPQAHSHPPRGVSLPGWQSQGRLIGQDDRWQDYQTNVPEAERKTGYRFFKDAPKIESIAKSAGRFSMGMKQEN